MESRNAHIKSKPRVFRLRNLPGHVDRLSAVDLLCKSVEGIAPQDVLISSLAYEADPWLRAPTKTATFVFRRHPPILSSVFRGGECNLEVPGLEKPLIIDDHFQGVTPLNSPPEDGHKHDCLVISGLASHPFGSWQRHGHDKSFMWIRDELPKRERLPHVRFLIYGYDTTLVGSTSFQTIPDLAVSLIETMKAIGWSMPSSRPALFLVHSLGGVILKQALVMLAGGGSQERAIIEKIKGAIFFGVPSQKMSMPDLFTMLGSQPNTALLRDLAESDFLARLDEQFGNISYLQNIQLFWAFETKVTPSVEPSPETGKYARTGPPTVMVSRESATRSLCHSHPLLTIQIDEDHSDMVKFAMGDHRIGIVFNKLASICGNPDTELQQRGLARRFTLDDYPTSDRVELESPIQGMSEAGTHHHKPTGKLEWDLAGFWNDDAIMSSLRAPERDRRLEQIDEKLGNTFNWAYDHPSTGLTGWLQRGSGIFWISGKPASGKSTLMKYLYQDRKTFELLRTGSWQSERRLTTSSFFFHHRGNNVQKSFEGLLRSIVSRVLEQEKSLFPLLYPILVQQYRTRVESAALGNLEEDLHTLLAHLGIPKTTCSSKLISETVALQREWTNSRKLGQHLQKILTQLGFRDKFSPEKADEEIELDDMDKILKTVQNQKSHNTGPSDSEWPKPTSWKAALQRTVSRHYQRERIKIEIETGSWSISHLEDALRRLVTQQLCKMDLVLFLDALDEYDGRPEFIASFLQGLVQPPSETDKPSLTRTRILFSSRPWKVFIDGFSACPGFRIHEYTRDDIFNFCAASIPNDPLAHNLLSPLVGEIVERARGVFLWVRLVMHDLSTTLGTVLQEGPMLDNSNLKRKLRATLDSLPDELGNYYQIIIERLPYGTRWETYVVLETICRSEKDMDLKTLLEIVQCSNSTTFTNGRNRLKQRTFLSSGDLGYIKLISGGLVEVGGLSAGGEAVLQFMHQTIMEFVQDPRFRVQILGAERGRLVRENGHSFIAKHAILLSNRVDGLFEHHARASETTMGFSQYAFFATVPQDFYWILRLKLMPQELLETLIDVAVYSGLQLCISDAYDADQLCIQNHPRDLVYLMNLRMYIEAEDNSEKYLASAGATCMQRIDMAKLLLAKGLVLQPCVHGLVDLLQFSIDGFDYYPGLQELAKILVEGLLDEDLTIPEPPSFRFAPSLSVSVAIDLIHFAPASVLRVLLARGVNPSSLQKGLTRNTPLDFIIAEALPVSTLRFRDKAESDSSAAYEWRRLRTRQDHERVSILVGYGGRLCSTSRSKWEAWVGRCVETGLDCSVFQDAALGFPLWCDDEEPEDEEQESRQNHKHPSRLRYVMRLLCFS